MPVHAEGGLVSYWAPDPTLARYVTGYHRYRVALPPGHVLEDVFFPSWAVMRFAVEDPQPWSLRRGSRVFDPVPSAMLEGPSSYAGYCRAARGAVIGIGILPEGWARLFGVPAYTIANRVVPLAALLDDAASLHRRLEGGDEPARVLDDWFLSTFAGAPPTDPLVGALYALIDDPAVTRVEDMIDRLGIPHRVLATLSKDHFGFTPKVLLRRGRFLRALSAGLAQGGNWDGVIGRAGYFDRSHFLRDSNLFLGCSIREFQARQGPLNALAMKVRAEVLGTAV
jgi:AraC-like DNA-binding protein